MLPQVVHVWQGRLRGAQLVHELSIQLVDVLEFPHFLHERQRVHFLNRRDHDFGIHVAGGSDTELLALVDLYEAAQQPLVCRLYFTIQALVPESTSHLLLGLEVVNQVLSCHHRLICHVVWFDLLDLELVSLVCLVFHQGLCAGYPLELCATHLLIYFICISL